MFRNGSETELYIDIYRKPTIEFVTLMDEVGMHTWQDFFRTRLQEEIVHTFNPSSPEHVEKSYDLMRGSSHFIGALAIAYDTKTTYAAPIGGMWADQTILPVKRDRIRDHFTGQRPMAVIQQANVLPSYQGQGIGLILGKQVLSHFRGNQRVGLDIMEEQMQLIDNLISKFGFNATPEAGTLNPCTSNQHFGGDYPTDDWHLEAPSVAEVLAKIAEYDALVPPYNIHKAT